jgi:hypothetical protein
MHITSWLDGFKAHTSRKEFRVDKRIIFKWILERVYKDLDWIQQNYNRDVWQTFVDVVMNCQIPLKQGISWSAV